MDWNWYLSEDATLRIYNKNDLYWEIDGCYNLTNKEINILALEYILQNQHEIRDDF